MLQSDTYFNTKEKKKKRKVNKTETKQKTKQNKQTNETKKKKKKKRSVCILLFDQLYVHRTADQESIFEPDYEGTNVDLVAPEKINQQLMNDSLKV